MRWLLLAIALSTTALTTGCGGLDVTLVEPRPNVNMVKQTGSLSIAFGAGVKDEFIVPDGNGLPSTEVDHWRASLRNGFINAYKDAFTLAPQNGDATIEIQEADLSWAPAAVAGTGTVMAITAQIRYKARLTKDGGKTVIPISGTVESKKAVTRANDASGGASNAIESLYEDMTNKFFAAPKS